MKRYYTIVNIAELYGYVEEVRDSELWSPDNPEGITFQEIAGPFGTIWGTHKSLEEAELDLQTFLKKGE